MPNSFLSGLCLTFCQSWYLQFKKVNLEHLVWIQRRTWGSGPSGKSQVAIMRFPKKNWYGSPLRSNWTPLVPIASRGRTVWPSVKYVDDFNKKTFYQVTPLTEFSGSPLNIFLQYSSGSTGTTSNVRLNKDMVLWDCQNNNCLECHLKLASLYKLPIIKWFSFDWLVRKLVDIWYFATVFCKFYHWYHYFDTFP